jgi:DNA-binding MarR family transcriptional regulator
MTLEQTLQLIQVAYPQVYLACHTRHQRKRSTPHRLSARDAAILAHLSDTTMTTPSKLAGHLGIARSTLSEALKRLTVLGFTTQTLRPGSAGARGGVGVLLTPKGVQAITETSVLEEPRLRALLGAMSEAERKRVALGMGALAAACGRLKPREPSSGDLAT